MSERVRQVLGEALQLTLEERAVIATELLASMDEPEDLDAESAWASEIERRARRALAGESKGVPLDTVTRRLDEVLGPR